MFKTRSIAPASGKLQGLSRGQTGTLAVIVKVQTPGHVPQAAQLRARIDDTLFTADVEAARLAEVEADPDVLAISPATRILPAGR